MNENKTNEESVSKEIPVDTKGMSFGQKIRYLFLGEEPKKDIVEQKTPERAPEDEISSDKEPVKVEANAKEQEKDVDVPAQVEVSEKNAPPAPPPPTNVVEFKNVSKYFGNGENKKCALKDINFVIEDLPKVGELITIVGMSGCGKSTLLRILAGLEPHYPPTEGEVLILGKKLTEAGSDRGLVDQKYSLLPHLTVLKNIAFGLRLRGVEKKEREEQAREWINKVGLNGFEDKFPSQLSGGMQQRVSIAATLILKPRIILMDEPFGALDPKTRMSMQNLLVELWKEQQSTIFFVTHQMDEAIYLGDRVFRMGTNPGRLIETLQVPRPDTAPEIFRKEPWFFPAVEELGRRLENEIPADGDWMDNIIKGVWSK